MRGQIISQEFNKMVWVRDNQGAEYSCTVDQDRKVRNKEDLTSNEQKSCMDLNVVLGDSW